MRLGMIAQKQLDISITDFFSGVQLLFSKTQSIHNTESTPFSQSLLSVRSGFDLLLSVLNFDKGSEVITTPINVPHIFDILHKHGLVIKVVDIDSQTILPTTESIKKALTDKTKMLFIAHLFGTKNTIDDLLFVKEQGVLIVEDMAQYFPERGDFSNFQGDVAFYSFGMIKTATCFGGGMVSFKGQGLYDRYKKQYHSYPVQKTGIYRKRYLRGGALALASTPFFFSIIHFLLNCFSNDLDAKLYNCVKSYRGNDFYKRIRFQCSHKQQELILKRVKNYNLDTIRLRKEKGNYLSQKIKNSVSLPGSESIIKNRHSFWVFPLCSDKKESIKERLRKHGFFASSTHGISCYDAQAAPVAGKMMDSILYIPFRSDMSYRLLDSIADLIIEGAG